MFGINDRSVRVGLVVTALFMVGGGQARAGGVVELPDAFVDVLHKFFPLYVKSPYQQPTPAASPAAPQPMRTSLPPGTHTPTGKPEPTQTEVIGFERYVQRVAPIGNREAHRVIQADRRAALVEYRRQVRLLTPEALAAATKLLAKGGSRAEAAHEAGRIYARGEQAARAHAVRVAEAYYKKGYAVAKARALAIANEYKDQLDETARKAAIEAMLREYKIKGKDRAQRADAAAKAVLAEASQKLAARVEAKLKQVEKELLAGLSRQAWEKGFAVYTPEEDAAYRQAAAYIDSDDEPTTDRTGTCDTELVAAVAPKPRAPVHAEGGMLGLATE